MVILQEEELSTASHPLHTGNRSQPSSKELARSNYTKLRWISAVFLTHSRLFWALTVFLVHSHLITDILKRKRKDFNNVKVNKVTKQNGAWATVSWGLPGTASALFSVPITDGRLWSSEKPKLTAETATGKANIFEFWSREVFLGKEKQLPPNPTVFTRT